MGSKVSFRAAALALAERHEVIAHLVAEAGLPVLRDRLPSPFAALVRSIAYQQLAGAAASAIHGRMVAVLEGEVSPETLAKCRDDTLRGCGLSASKLASIRDLASKVSDGTVELDPRRLARLDDEAIVDALSSVRGIGRWTAEMFLLFHLRRLDVWPAGDLGVRRGFGLAWGVPMPTAKELDPLGEPFRPYRSVVAWYCWRAVELSPAALPQNTLSPTGAAPPTGTSLRTGAAPPASAAPHRTPSSRAPTRRPGSR